LELAVVLESLERRLARLGGDREIVLLTEVCNALVLGDVLG
jgi:hypothetical protein